MPDDDEVHTFRLIMSGQHLDSGGNSSHNGGTVELSSMPRKNGDIGHHRHSSGHNEGKREEDPQEEEEKPVVIMSPKKKRVHAFLNRKQEVIL